MKCGSSAGSVRLRASCVAACFTRSECVAAQHNVCVYGHTGGRVYKLQFYSLGFYRQSISLMVLVSLITDCYW